MGPKTNGYFIDYDLVAKGEEVMRYNLQENGQGVANPKIARRYNLKSVLSYPLTSEGRLLGYLNHFSSESVPFSKSEKQLMEIFARQAVVTIERFEHYRMLEHSSSILNALSQNLLLGTPGDFLRYVSKKACELLSVPVCLVWKLDEKQKKLKIVATTGNVDNDYKKIELDLNAPGVQQHLKKKVAFLLDATKPNPNYAHSEEAKKRGWISLLSAPMRVDDHLIGMLDVYTQSKRYFKEWEKEVFCSFANHAALSIQKAEDLTSRKQLEKLNEVMQEMTEAHDIDDLLELLLDKGLELIRCKRGWISRLDFKTNQLHILAHRDYPPKLRTLNIGQGITGKALQDEQPIRVDDVKSKEWEGSYEEFWPDTRSELAVPILISKAEVRVGTEVKYGAKPIGVFNIESSNTRAFSQTDVDILWSLARQAAIRIERLDFDRKLAKLAEIEKEIVGKQDWDDIIQIVLEAITETLGYEYVNISLVNRELNRIKSEYLIGFPDHEVEEFKRMADHSLDSNNIQADIVRSRQIEVPDFDDKRFDPKIQKRFGRDRLIRLFIPMYYSSDDQVIGTVEAGYQRHSRKYIYEQDIQILQGFVDYTVMALEQRRRGLIERISHEFRAAIVGIRSNASFLQRRIKELDKVLIHLKFDDILTDCELLLLQVKDLEFSLGRPSPISKIERTLVFRDIIIKTINQLKPLVKEEGFDPSKIIYNPGDIRKIDAIYVDKVKINQVVYNLLTNSIKYAEDNPNKFTIEIYGDETRNTFIIKFRDWGIGI
ncbi:MAG: GAF domain-containing protein, partial [bacterium]